jgi:hypothetical protein
MHRLTQAVGTHTVIFEAPERKQYVG